jgi:phosphoenolpyruvate carboxylase
MNYLTNKSIEQFENLVSTKFQLYNSLFTSLPFHKIENTGVLLSLLLHHCEEGFKKNDSPKVIIEDFVRKHTSFNTEEETLNLLFRFIQYIERQVVLFDAIEDAAFSRVNDIDGEGSVKKLIVEAYKKDRVEALQQKIQHFDVKLVLTAHPTQFYPGAVLGIIHDLAKSIANNNTAAINAYLQQLGKTPFLKRQRPTPYDEAVSLIWYLENVFYTAAGNIMSNIKANIPSAATADLINIGFWPGGDRDGNPFVEANTTLKVARALRGAILKCYYLDIRKLKRRLTFKHIDVLLQDLEDKIYNDLFLPDPAYDVSLPLIVDTLQKIKEILIYEHNSLFINYVDDLLTRVQIFKLHFATLDIRQESTVHVNLINAIAKQFNVTNQPYVELDEQNRVKALESIATTNIHDWQLEEPIFKDTIQTIQCIQQIQQENGTAGCYRYIISQCKYGSHVLEVFALLQATLKTKEIPVDIVPLFETINDLQHAESVMKQLYEYAPYMKHIEQRGQKQVIMLGFSDGTKDGGYLMANWSIYSAKDRLTRLSKTYNIDVVFFDGRGGPPARGGGKTHNFYAGMGKNIANNAIQLTIQGQTISSNFGTITSAQYNMEQLVHAGLSNSLFEEKPATFDAAETILFEELANASYEKYVLLKNNPYFMEYLTEVGPLKYYSQTNIGSRPAKRNSGNKLTLQDLRAIPYVGTWAQLKQNVTGFFGLGTALKSLADQGKLDKLKQLYKKSLYFKTLIDNSEMAMKKCFFPLTTYLSNDAKFGDIWNEIYAEYQLSKHFVAQLSGNGELMTNNPIDSLSISLREKIVMPLLTIQQFALQKIRAVEKQELPPVHKAIYEKLVIRAAFGIINAGRNSA